jgi:hypothetical protein
MRKLIYFNVENYDLEVSTVETQIRVLNAFINSLAGIIKPEQITKDNLLLIVKSGDLIDYQFINTLIYNNYLDKNQAFKAMGLSRAKNEDILDIPKCDSNDMGSILYIGKLIQDPDIWTVSKGKAALKSGWAEILKEDSCQFTDGSELQNQRLEICQEILKQMNKLKPLSASPDYFEFNECPLDVSVNGEGCVNADIVVFGKKYTGMGFVPAPAPQTNLQDEKKAYDEAIKKAVKAMEVLEKAKH